MQEVTSVLQSCQSTRPAPSKSLPAAQPTSQPPKATLTSTLPSPLPSTSSQPPKQVFQTKLQLPTATTTGQDIHTAPPTEDTSMTPTSDETVTPLYPGGIPLLTEQDRRAALAKGKCKETLLLVTSLTSLSASLLQASNQKSDLGQAPRQAPWQACWQAHNKLAGELAASSPSRATRSKNSSNDAFEALVSCDPPRGFIIRKSQGKGLGVFATETLSPGQPLYVYGGKLITNKEAEQLENEKESVFRYFFSFKGEKLWYVLSLKTITFALWKTNKSWQRQRTKCPDESIGFQQSSDPVFVLCKKIQKHEEVLYDYGIRNLPWLHKTGSTASTKTKKTRSNPKRRKRQKVDSSVHVVYKSSSSGYRGSSTSGVRGVSTPGVSGSSESDNEGSPTSGVQGSSSSGYGGSSTCDVSGSPKSDNGESSTSGVRGSSSPSNGGNSTSGLYGSSSADNGGGSTSCVCGSLSADSGERSTSGVRGSSSPSNGGNSTSGLYGSFSADNGESSTSVVCGSLSPDIGGSSTSGVCV
ncbi:uncharacterized protein LOC117292407 [Asterias rubens]|uniref:uncharacterized protein LOC117292407 n=1 Tax=Asterias rubens TaxID=7604 RepID=UPI0014556F4D|nr:uncharacterized protein LOC117292407 [Asterias rubens]